MEMRPRYRGRLDSSEIVYPRTKWSDYQNAPSDETRLSSSVSSNEQREIRDVVEEVRHELLQRSESLDGSFELPRKEELMNADPNDSAFWTPSLFDGEESSELSSRAPHMRDFRNAPTPILRNFDDESIETRTVSTTIGSTTVGSTTQGSIHSGPTIDTNTSDSFGSSCFTGLDEIANDAQEIFCCGSQMEELSNTSNAVVETAATELLHDSILQSADSFFSDDQARSIGTTFSQVSQEFDMAGNRMVDLTRMISTENLCVKKDNVHDDVVEQDTSTVPTEVKFKKRVLTTLNIKNNKKGKKRSKRRVLPQEKKGVDTKKSGMFGKLKGRFKKSGKGRS